MVHPPPGLRGQRVETFAHARRGMGEPDGSPPVPGRIGNQSERIAGSVAVGMGSDADHARCSGIMTVVQRVLEPVRALAGGWAGLMAYLCR
eukprot:11076175-Alexandrium_andersonii.AAC.1